MRIKFKLIFIFLLISIALAVCIYFSFILYQLLGRNYNGLPLPNLAILEESVGSILKSRMHFMLFTSLVGLVFMIAILPFILTSQPYKSNLRQITPDIMTPIAAGQKQFGSAEWLGEREKRNIFSYYTLKREDKIIKALLKSKDYKKGR